MTPAEIAARAAAVAAKWTPERLRRCQHASHDAWGPTGTEPFDDIEALLDERDLLRGLVAAAHTVHASNDSVDLHDGTVEWHIECMVEDCDFETTLTGTGVDLLNALRGVYAAHVAAILDGGGA